MTNYTRWATVISLAEGLRYAGKSVTYFTDIGDYPLKFETSLERLVHALVKDSSDNYGPREDLTVWESLLPTAQAAYGATPEHATEAIANYRRRREALVTFLKSE